MSLRVYERTNGSESELNHYVRSERSVLIGCSASLRTLDYGLRKPLLTLDSSLRHSSNES